ncbi:Cation efflux system protein [Chlamydia trachomatis]|nr:Cation efflux system protein [Chlamydia trachomatis]
MVPLAYNIRWLFHINARGLQWLCELRSQPQGHESYRKIAIDMAREVIQFHPAYELFLKFVDYSETDLGRLQQESRKKS